MRIKLVTQFFLLAIACGHVASCTAVSKEKPLPTRVTPARSQASEHIPVEMKVKLISEIQDNLYDEKFAPIDAIASQARDGKEKFLGGTWKLYAVYHTLSAPFGNSDATDRQWEFHLTKLRQWINQYPNSITARVALGSALVAYAWHARGYGYASTVTEDGWRLFRDRLELAEKALNGKDEWRGKCPHGYVAMLSVGVGQGWEYERFDKLFREAIRIEPDYFYVHRVKALYLLPRWHGEPGDWEEFADEAYRQRGAEEGAILYYLITSHIYNFYRDRFFQENKISWPRMKQGFIALEARHGATPSRLNEACKFAALAGDRETARGLFDRIGENWDASVWRSKVNFDVYRAWSRHATKL